ncbi:branched-chain amino acid aminotransferase [Microlunatus sp. Gsoil 973]|uniref:branched-chain amino acid aminotransferase n=1 Tax=Microlunatus sp. Gsoil 973 TaxID=2672569 RepID=UPI0012B4E9DD|nr:branched-chain amino acid aminotransferase [Microlunatus sp. Gsoil 973]QGN33103.1 branched-chain amino acid aminotransferase [Microlunatus sp. Gsoil 973]
MFEVHQNPQPRTEAERAAILADPGFGLHFSDHMALATWTADLGWHDREVGAYRPFQLDPASAVLHYAQEIFEGLKAYRHANDSIWLFRPDKNAERFARSAARLALPVLPTEDFLSSIETLVTTDQAWVPGGGESNLYIRPFMFANEVFLGVRPARTVTYCCIASPAAAYFPNGVQPVNIWLSMNYVRAAGPGGMGAAKTGGNYAASLVAQQEAYEHGCEQVLFLDGAERKWVEELGGMNVYLVAGDELITPALEGTILEGVTRDSVLTLGAERGLVIQERRIAIDEVLDGIESGAITEIFACGTAAVINPIGSIKTAEKTYTINGGQSGPHTDGLRSTLLDIQYGRAEDTHGWMHKVC